MASAARPSLSRWVQILFGQKSPEVVELALPRSAVIPDPLLEHTKPGGLDAAGADPADFLGMRKPCLFEDLQVLGYGRQGNAKRLGELGDGCGPGNQPVENGPTRGIAQRMEQPIDVDPSVCHECSLWASLPCQVLAETGQERAPALLDHLVAARPIDEGPLVGQYEVGSRA